MTNVNQCDLHCPVKAIMAAKYRIEQARATNPLAKLLSATNTGLRGVNLMARSAMTCPSRNLPEGQWHACQPCITEAQNTASETAVTRAQLTSHEEASLKGIRLRDEPPALDK